MQYRIFDPSSGQPGDYRILQSVGPYTLKANKSVIVSVILGSATNKDQLFETIEVARLTKANSTLFESELETNVQNINDSFCLLDIYPNPFNPATTILYIIPKDSEVEIDVYNYLGQKITNLISGFMTAGKYYIKWQPNNIPSGVYFLTLRSSDFYKVKRVVYMK